MIIERIEIPTFQVHPDLSGTLVTIEREYQSKWQLILTEIGICFTFNSKFVQLLSPNGTKSSSVKMLKCHYLNGVCYARYDSDPTLPLKYYIHSYMEFPHASSKASHEVEKGDEIEINYRMIEAQASPDIKYLGPSQRMCRFEDEPLTNDVPSYSLSICYTICRYRLDLEFCGCKPFFYHFLAEGKVCTPSGLVCLSKYVDQLTQVPSQLGCVCPQPCHSISYSPLNPKYTKWEDGGYFDQRIAFRWGLLHPTTKYRRDILFGFGDLIGTYSSFFILLLPFSALSNKHEIVTAAIVCLIVALRIPPPVPSAVEAILGKDPLSEFNNGNDFVVKTVAHRGAGLDAPENSLAAFKVCSQKGCDTIEFDVSLTKDGVPIVFHDQTLERMANSNLIVSEATWEELSHVDISVNHSLKDRFVNTNIPTLEQAVQQLLTDGQRMFIDIKVNNSKIVGVINELFKKHPELVSRAVVTSFFPNIIYWIRRSNPNIVGSLSYRPFAFSYDSFKYPEGRGTTRSESFFKHYSLCFLDLLHAWAVPRILYYLLGLSIILLQKDTISGKEILDWHSKGVRVVAWSANSPIEKQHLSRNLKITYFTDTLTGDNTVHFSS
ncbi:hypothetical protein JTB14_029987 [Gonioctena quinquepunctata]|nr:hypothetical protein JTB14_029987 [Gonioctena quinquepunctata]